MGTKSKRLGRPMKAPGDGDRVQLSLRVTASVKRKLDAAAVVAGRSQSQEAELRLEKSFDRQDLLGEVLALAYGDFGKVLQKIANQTELRTIAMAMVQKASGAQQLAALLSLSPAEVTPPSAEEFKAAKRAHGDD